jgi:hypothetical protein
VTWLILKQCLVGKKAEKSSKTATFALHLSPSNKVIFFGEPLPLKCSFRSSNPPELFLNPMAKYRLSYS